MPDDNTTTPDSPETASQPGPEAHPLERLAYAAEKLVELAEVIADLLKHR